MHLLAAAYSLILILTALTMLGFALYMFGHPRRGRVPMGAIALLVGAEWLFALLMEYHSVGLEAKLVWNKLEYIGIALTPVAWLALCFEQTGRERLLRPKFLAPLATPPLALIGLAATNDLHGLLWRRAYVSPGSPLLQKEFGPAFWVLVAYSLGLVTAGMALLLRKSVIARHYHRKQAVALLAGAGVVLLANVADVVLEPAILGGLDVAPLAFAAVSLIVLYGFARLKFRETFPIAYEAALEALPEGVLVLDAERRLLYANPAGLRLILTAPGAPRPRSLAELPQQFQAALGNLETTGPATRELAIGARAYEVSVSLIEDWKGDPSGWVVVAQDVTHLKQAEDQLSRLNDELERMVEERTRELIESNRALSAEIRERRRAEQIIRRSLQEKEVLLREIHHRVKNNLQLIGSMLKLPTTRLKDQDAIAVLNETYNRVRTIGILYEILHKSTDLTRISVSRYLQGLVTQLMAVHEARSSGVAVSVEVEELHMDIDRAILCGMLVNELVSNALRHAFPQGGPGRIWVSLAAEGEGLVLTVGDDGVGIPASIDVQSAGTLGLRIVRTLTTQLKGKLELDRSRGTVFRIRFAADEPPF